MRPGDHSLITVRDIIAECITVRDIIAECAEMITVDGVDHWLFNDIMPVIADSTAAACINAPLDSGAME
jgi:hypothetical protein